MHSEEYRTIGVIYGIHPDEEKSLTFYKNLQGTLSKSKSMVSGLVEVIIGNELAYQQGGLRYSKDGVNLNLAFPGNPDSPIYEERRATELVEWAKKFDLVLDIHGTPLDNSDCLIVHPEANLTLRGIASYLGYANVLTPTRGTIADTLPNVASIELSPNTMTTPSAIRHLIFSLARGAQYVESFAPPYRYRWFETTAVLPREEAMTVHPHTIQPFTPLPPEVIDHFALDPQSRAYLWSAEKGHPEIIRPIRDPWQTRAEQRVAA